LVEAGTVALDSTGVKELTLGASQPLASVPNGMIWLAMALQNSSGTVPVLNGMTSRILPSVGNDPQVPINAYYFDSITGALPAALGGFMGGAPQGPLLHARVTG